ncbi:PREDICTED: putative calcium-transporting ATPase 13, plasma membrane-type [Nicotiana attenuata]|uniref:putative calcium-transporting ATPase 13, plasma membrane-type n=1 Tax=Nicotiana attenuata TaxID=49451 RepID=UPI000905325D|nr:PREDICTED: putative calcium-transporting ATPase 13, plasma membrane-type [Nicotiana attenuata]
MALHSPKHSDAIIFLSNDSSLGKLKPQKRLQLVFRAIYFVTFLTKKKIGRNTLILSQLLRNPSVVIDIESINDHKEEELFHGINKEALAKLVREKDFNGLLQFGGVLQIIEILGSDQKSGLRLNENELEKRKETFGSNIYPKPPAKTFLSFVLEAFKDTTIIILLVCAVFSLGFGIKQHGPKEGWYDGGSIIVAVVLVLAVSSISNFKQSRQFMKLSDESKDIKVEVVRDGRRQEVSIFEIVVGDVVCLKIGDHIAADGLFLDGHSLQVDESSMTGESDHVQINKTQNPFLVCGTKVMDGYGHMLVTSVGTNNAWGQMMSNITDDKNEQTPLQQRLNKLTKYIGNVGLLMAFLVLVTLLIRYFTGHSEYDNSRREFIGSKTKAGDIMNSLVRMIAAAVTIIVVAIPEGLPLAVTLTLAYSMRRMMLDHAMVRKLSACETMGSATTICTDKTGTLTLHKMQVTEFWLGTDMIMTTSQIAPEVLEMLQEAAGLNTTGEVYMTPSGPPEISGGPTEKAILSWAMTNLLVNFNELNREHRILHVEVFNSQKKRSGVLVLKNSTGKVHTHWKGAAEIILAMCSTYYVKGGIIAPIDHEERKELELKIKYMASKSLRCIAFACKESNAKNQILEETELTLLGLVGLKDPCRPGIKEAVESCRAAGVSIKMITGDNVFTAKSIALECGILQPAEDLNIAVIEGPTFRNYSQEERMKIVERICVMARSSPFDKLLMVECLKQKGHVVAVTGDGTNDAPALKAADVGLSMGIQGTEVAKESSDIVILDDNFNTVVTVLKWGRCVYNNIQKFIQFQLTVNVAALVINFVAAASSGEVPLTAVQLLWVNLIMDTLGALALATERPSSELMNKKPVGRTEPLITAVMWRNIIAQALYQVTVLLILQFKGSAIFHVNKKVKDTLIFNTFVFCQVFNEFHARKLEKKNIFHGILKNRLFIGIVGMTILLQVIMVEFLRKFADTERLDWRQWAVCMGISSLSWPIGWIMKCIPVSNK